MIEMWHLVIELKNVCTIFCIIIFANSLKHSYMYKNNNISTKKLPVSIIALNQPNHNLFLDVTNKCYSYTLAHVDVHLFISIKAKEIQINHLLLRYLFTTENIMHINNIVNLKVTFIDFNIKNDRFSLFTKYPSFSEKCISIRMHLPKPIR